MELIKDYKENNALRASFNQLATETFGISFEAWYQKGYWDSNYIPYSMVEGDRVVANASANRMTLHIEGTTYNAIQIGTVMTHPDYRRRGLAKGLLEQIIHDFKDQTDVFFLAADEEAKSLYRSCGFVEIPSVSYSWENGLAQPMKLEHIKLTDDEVLRWKRATDHNHRRFKAGMDDHILAFYLAHGFDDKLYLFDENTLIIADVEDEGKTVILYGIYVKGDENLERILLSTGASKVVFEFDAAGLTIGLSKAITEKSGWMVLEHKGPIMPKPLAYPRLAQA